MSAQSISGMRRLVRHRALRVVDAAWDDRGTTAGHDARGDANHQEGSA